MNMKKLATLVSAVALSATVSANAMAKDTIALVLDQQHTVIIEQIEELQHTLEIIETERLKYSNIINKNHTAIICS